MSPLQKAKIPKLKTLLEWLPILSQRGLFPFSGSGIQQTGNLGSNRVRGHYNLIKSDNIGYKKTANTINLCAGTG